MKNPFISLKLQILSVALLLVTTGSSLAVDILYIGRDVSANTGDTQVINHLEGRYGSGSVSYIRDIDSLSSDGDGRDLIVVSESVSSVNVGDKFKGATAGIVTTEVFILDDMALTSNSFTGLITPDDVNFTFSGSGPVQTQAGLSGTVAIWDSIPAQISGVQTSAILSPGAVVEASTSSGVTTYYSLLSFEAGTLDIDSNLIAGRRVFYAPDRQTLLSPGTNTSISGFTTEGLALFDASTDWALGIAIIPEPSTYMLFLMMVAAFTTIWVKRKCRR